MPNFQTVDFSRAAGGFHPGGQPDMAALRQATGSEGAANKMAVALAYRKRGRRRAALIDALTDRTNALAAPIIGAYAAVLTQSGASEGDIQQIFNALSKGRISVRFAGTAMSDGLFADGAVRIVADGNRADVTIVPLTTEATPAATSQSSSSTSSGGSSSSSSMGDFQDVLDGVAAGAATGSKAGAVGGAAVGSAGGVLLGGVTAGPTGTLGGGVAGGTVGAAQGGAWGGLIGGFWGGVLVIVKKLTEDDEEEETKTAGADDDSGEDSGGSDVDEDDSAGVMELPDGRGDYRPDLGW